MSEPQSFKQTERVYLENLKPQYVKVKLRVRSVISLSFAEFCSHSVSILSCLLFCEYERCKGIHKTEKGKYECRLTSLPSFAKGMDEYLSQTISQIVCDTP